MYENTVYIINRKIHGCLEIPDIFLVLNIISHSFATLTREISCSTLEINLVFPRTHVLFSIKDWAPGPPPKEGPPPRDRFIFLRLYKILSELLRSA